jgi:hypothetical protein
MIYFYGVECFFFGTHDLDTGNTGLLFVTQFQLCSINPLRYGVSSMR